MAPSRNNLLASSVNIIISDWRLENELWIYPFIINLSVLHLQPAMIKTLNHELLLQIPPKDRAKVKSVYSYDDRLWLGYTNGTLEVYKLSIINPTDENDRFSDLKLLDRYEQFSKRSIDQICLLEKLGYFVILSDYVVSIYSLDTFKLYDRLQQSKGATVLAVSNNSNNSRILIGIKRKLISYVLKEGKLSDPEELIAPDRLKSILFVDSNNIILCTNSDYFIINLTTLKLSPLVTNGSHSLSSTTQSSSFSSFSYWGGRYPKSHAIMLQQNKQILLVKDSSSVLIDNNFELIDRPLSQWQIIPEIIGHLSPYIIAAYQKNVEVKNLESGSTIETLEISGIEQIIPLNNEKFKNSILLINQQQIYICKLIPLEKQINELSLSNKTIDESISLLLQIPEDKKIDYFPLKNEKLRDLQILKGIQLFKNGKFDIAMKIFSDFNAPPDKVIELFPASISGKEISNNNNNHNKKIEKEKNSLIDNNQSQDDELSSTPSSPQKLPNTDSDDTDTDNISLYNSMIRSPKKQSLQRKNLLPQLSPAEKKLLASIRQLLPYLADTRRKISKLLICEQSENNNDKEIIDSNGQKLTNLTFGSNLLDAAKFVDTALFRCYMIASPGLVGPLVRVHNHCDPEAVKDKLSTAGKWRELIDFYYSKSLHKEALELLKSLGSSLQKGNKKRKKPVQRHNSSISQVNFGDNEEEDQDNDDEDEDETDDTSLSTSPLMQSMMAFIGPEPTIHYLQRLNNDYIDLIFEFSKWPLSIDIKYGIDLFLEDSIESESLNHEKVVNFLSNISKVLTEQYLIHIINNLHDKSSKFHNKLIELYIEKLKNDKIGNNNGQWDFDLDKICKFLTSSQWYEPDKILKIIPNELDYVILKALCYSRRGEHSKVLDIYVFQMEDYLKAKEYCSNIYESDQSKGVSLLHNLLKLYLQPSSLKRNSFFGNKNSSTINLKAGLELLESQGSRMLIIEVIKIIPINLKILNLNLFLKSQLRNLTKKTNEINLESSLRKINLLQIQSNLINKQQTPIRINELQTCNVCNKRLGHSVISVFPNKTVIHYGCLKQYQKELEKKEVIKKNQTQKLKYLDITLNN